MAISVCGVCRHEFIVETPDTGLAQARKEYRARHSMVNPEQMVAWREKQKMSQAQLATIMGWGIETVQRYEAGKLASTTHDKALQHAMREE